MKSLDTLLAEAVGKKKQAAEYRELFSHIKDAFNKKYVKTDGSLERGMLSGLEISREGGIRWRRAESAPWARYSSRSDSDK